MNSVRRIALIALVALASISAQAEWIFLIEQDGVKHFVDSSVKKTDDGMRRIWVLLNMDMGAALASFSYSSRSLQEWDCRQERYRILTAKTYSGLMASGSIIREMEAASDWSYIPPESIGVRYLKFACAGK